MKGGEPITVYKLDAQGNEQWRYPATVIERGANSIRLEALFNRDDMDLGFTLFKRGDRFVETFYADRWYNVFAVYDRDDGALKGWYCNVCRPAITTATAVRSDDLALDVWITPDGEAQILDQEEFAALPIPDGERSQALSALTDLLAHAAGGRLPR
jgi:protein associated with RNAse G/E